VFQFSSVLWEGARRGGDSSNLAAGPQGTWFNMKLPLGLCFPGPMNGSGSAEAEEMLLLPWDGDNGDGTELGHITN